MTGPTRRTVLGGLAALPFLGGPALAGAGGGGSSAGVALGLFASDAHWDYRPMLDELVALRCPRVLLVVPHYQASVRASSLGPRAGFSPAHATIDRTLAAARNRGLQVALMPIVRLTRRTPTEWRGVLQPRDLDRWHAAWTRFVVDLARLARAHRAERLMIGSEFASLEADRDRWAAHIGELRQHFPGKLVYSANWDHHSPVPFWDLVDEIGITGYFRLCPPGARLDAEGAARAWLPVLRRLHAFADGHGKPLLLTELGWPALQTAASHPWDDTRDAPADPRLPAELWRGFLKARAIVGRDTPFYAWNWFGRGAGVETGFGLRGQPAAEELRRAFEGVGSRGRVPPEGAVAP